MSPLRQHLATLTALSALITPALSATILNCTNPSIQQSQDLGFTQDTFIGTIPHLNHHSTLTNTSSPLIVTQYKNGTHLPYNDWSFWACSNFDSHPFPPGFKPCDCDQPENYAFGIIQPTSADGSLGESCLALAGRGKTEKLVLARNCSAVPDRYRTFMIATLIYDDGYNLIYDANANTTWVLEQGGHGVVTLVEDYDGQDGAGLEFGVAEY